MGLRELIEKESRECQEKVSIAVKKGILSIKPPSKRSFLDKVKEKCLLIEPKPKLSFEFGINEGRYRKRFCYLNVSEKELITRECLKHIKNLYCYNNNRRYHFEIYPINDIFTLKVVITEHRKNLNENVVKRINSYLMESIFNIFVSQTYYRIKYDCSEIHSNEWDTRNILLEDEYRTIIKNFEDDEFKVDSSYDYIVGGIVYNHNIKIKLKTDEPKGNWINFQDQDKQSQICNSESQDQSDHHSSKTLDSNHMKVE